VLMLQVEVDREVVWEVEEAAYLRQEARLQEEVQESGEVWGGGKSEVRDSEMNKTVFFHKVAYVLNDQFAASLQVTGFH